MKAIYLRFNRWAGIGRAEQGDLFSCAFRLGFVTLFVCRVCLITRIQETRDTINEAIRQIEARHREFDGR